MRPEPAASALPLTVINMNYGEPFLVRGWFTVDERIGGQQGNDDGVEAPAALEIGLIGVDEGYPQIHVFSFIATLF